MDKHIFSLKVSYELHFFLYKIYGFALIMRIFRSDLVINEYRCYESIIDLDIFDKQKHFSY